MKLTRERKVYAAVLALAVVALGADRFLFSAPEIAAAEPGSLLVQSEPRPKAFIKGESARPVAAKLPGLGALARRMDEVSKARGLQAGNVADPFRPPAGWLKAEATQTGNGLSEFAAKHHLVAVLKSSRGGIAVVNGATRKSLRIGQQLDGFKLVAIGEKSVTFQSALGTVDLGLPEEQQTDSQIVTSPAR